MPNTPVKLSYDKATDSLYFHLSDRVGADTLEPCEGAVLDYDEDGKLVGIDLQHASQRPDVRSLVDAGGVAGSDGIVHLRFSTTPIVREVSQDWHTHISYAEDGTVVEIVLLAGAIQDQIPISASSYNRDAA